MEKREEENFSLFQPQSEGSSDSFGEEKSSSFSKEGLGFSLQPKVIAIPHLRLKESRLGIDETKESDPSWPDGPNGPSSDSSREDETDQNSLNVETTEDPAHKDPEMREDPAHENPEMRIESVLSSASESGEEGIRSLKNLANDSNEAVITMVVQVVVEIAASSVSEFKGSVDPFSIESLIRRIFHEKSSNIRTIAARSVMNIDEDLETKIEILRSFAFELDTNALNSEKRNSELLVVRALMESIESFGFSQSHNIEHLIHLVFDSLLHSSSIKMALAQMAVNRRQRGFSVLVTLLNLPNNSEEVKEEIILSTVQMLLTSTISIEQAFRLFEKLVNDENPKIRTALAQAVRNFGSEKGMQFLIAYLMRDKNPEVIEAVVQSIIHLFHLFHASSQQTVEASLNEAASLHLISLIPEVIRGPVALNVFHAIDRLSNNSLDIKRELIFSLGEAIQELAINREEGLLILGQYARDTNFEIRTLAIEIAKQWEEPLKLSCQNVISDV